MKKPLHEQMWIWILVILAVAFLPFLINLAYSYGAEQVVGWSKSDLLSFYGTFLSFAGTVVLGIVAVEQSKKANELSKRMLDIEAQHEIPIIDIIEIVDAPTDSIELRNALQISLNDIFYYIQDDGTLSEDSSPVVAFQLKNISSTHIISMKVERVSAQTYFCYNGARISIETGHLSYSGGLRVFGEGDSQYIIIGGISFQYPKLSEDELLRQDYVNPIIEAEFEFVLGNIRGRIYKETIQIQYAYLPSNNRIYYPCILEKEIKSVVKFGNQR